MCRECTNWKFHSLGICSETNKQWVQGRRKTQNFHLWPKMEKVFIRTTPAAKLLPFLVLIPTRPQNVDFGSCWTFFLSFPSFHESQNCFLLYLTRTTSTTSMNHHRYGRVDSGVSFKSSEKFSRFRPNRTRLTNDKIFIALRLFPLLHFSRKKPT